MNKKIILLLLLFASRLHSLEIWINDSLYREYSDEGLLELSYIRPDTNIRGIYLKELLPLIKEFQSFSFISSDYIMETDYNDSLFISLENNRKRLYGDDFGTIHLPEVIKIQGTLAETELLTIWLDEEDQFLKREISLFGNLHNIDLEYRIEKNLTSLLEYNQFNNFQVPDLIIYDQNKLLRLSPLLRKPLNSTIINTQDIKAITINAGILALPFKISRHVFLSGSSNGENKYLVSDFGDFNSLFPIFKRFGMKKNIDLNSDAVKDCFFYLTGLYKQEIYKIEQDKTKEFISGRIDSIFTSSTIFSKLPKEPKIEIGNHLPGLGNEQLQPLLHYKLISFPKSSPNYSSAEKLALYLTGIGVQQRINPETGYLPSEREVYPLLKESNAKDLLLENMDRAISLPPSEELGRLKFVLPKITNLIITERLTLDEGILEIQNYVDQ